MNIATNLERTAFFFPDAPAVIEGDRTISYQEFNRDASRVAGALRQLGVQPGNNVALFSPNSYDWLAFYFGAIKAGARAATISPALTPEEARPILADCQPKAVLTIDERLAEVQWLRDETGCLAVVAPGAETPMARILEMGHPDFRPASCDRHDPAAILYTGGTTGVSKGVLLSHENLQTSYQNVAFNERSTPSDRCLCFLPLNHVFAQVHIMGATVYSAGSIVLQSSFDMDRALDAIQRRHITKFYSVPTVYVRLLGRPDLKERLKSVRYCFSAAASMAAEMVREWKARTGLDIHEAYGMTESASMVTFNHYHRHVVGSVGTPANLVEVEIRDFEGEPLDPGTEGEICIRGPNIMKAYLNRPRETAAAFWGEWFRSGDIGVVDEHGYLYIVDRLKDLIITGGENVYPREIEEVLYTRPEVLECAVIGVPDAEYGERVIAVITPKPGREVNGTELKTFLKTRLAPFKVPKQYMHMDQMPKSAAGKLLKREIRRELVKEM